MHDGSDWLNFNKLQDEDFYVMIELFYNFSCKTQIFKREKVHATFKSAALKINTRIFS